MVCASTLRGSTSIDTSASGNFDSAARRYLELYGAASVQCGLHHGALEAVAAVHAAGVRQVVISASQQDNLRVQLAPFGLDAYLDGVHGIADGEGGFGVAAVDGA